MQQYAEVVGSAAKQADFRRHELGPFGTLEWVNRITRVNELARPCAHIVSALLFHGSLPACRSTSSTCGIFTASGWVSWPAVSLGAAFAHCGAKPPVSACSVSAMRRPTSDCFARRPSAVLRSCRQGKAW